MLTKYPNTYFTTLAIDRFVSVFKDFPESNFIILNSFKHLVDSGRVKIYAFVIMRDHIHIVWQVLGGQSVEDVIMSFKKHTGKLICNYLKDVDRKYLEYFISDRKDREYKIWKISKGNILVNSPNMLNVKIRYIHKNPTKGDYKTVEDSTSYYFSSAKAYSVQSKNFSFLSVLDEVVNGS